MTTLNNNNLFVATKAHWGGFLEFYERTEKELIQDAENVNETDTTINDLFDAKEILFNDFQSYWVLTLDECKEFDFMKLHLSDRSKFKKAIEEFIENY